MKTLTIRKIEDEVQEALKKIAADDGRSVEGYVRKMIYNEVEQNKSSVKQNLAEEVRALMIEHGVFFDDDLVVNRTEKQREVVL